jgi:iron-sulfur cluster repair protein YtfE (RIC family)
MTTTKKGATDATLLLQHDHELVAALFERAETDPNLFEEIRDELTTHATIEEEIFYPALRQALPESERARVDEALADHTDVRQTLAELADMVRESDEFKEMLSDLRDSVAQHVEEEEDELFEKAQQALGPEGLADLGARMQSRKKELTQTVGA